MQQRYSLNSLSQFVRQWFPKGALYQTQKEIPEANSFEDSYLTRSYVVTSDTVNLIPRTFIFIFSFADRCLFVDSVFSFLYAMCA